MFLVAVIVMIGVFGLWIHAMNRAGDDEDDARAERLQNRWIIGGGLVLPLTSMAALLHLAFRPAIRCCHCRPRTAWRWTSK